MEELTIPNSKVVVLEANPEVYDYLHQITLNFETNTFELIDGGGQMVTGNIFGSFELVNSKLKLNYEYDQNIYTKEKIPLNISKEITFEINNELKKHFNGYCMYNSSQTITLSESPFEIHTIKEHRPHTLFNMLNDNKYPLTFYNDLQYVECDVQHERLIRNNI